MLYLAYHFGTDSDDWTLLAYVPTASLQYVISNSDYVNKLIHNEI